jgi:anion-transporting  ArsA/GET3 family ATPase
MEKSQDLKNTDIADYVKSVETYYMSQFQKLKLSLEKRVQRIKAKTNLQASELDRRTELEEIFSDAVNKVKAQIFRRKQRSDSQPARLANQAATEDTLIKLDEYGKEKVSFEEFTTSDK